MSTPAAQSNLDRITAFLRGKGLGAVPIAGVEGNLQTESGFNPSAHNPRENAWGLAQWEGGRLTNLQSFAASRHTPITDLDTQLNFMWAELTGSEAGSLHSLLGATTVDQAATVFDQQYERSSAASLPARIANAQHIAAGGVQGGSGQVFGVTNVGDTAPSGASTLGTILGAISGGLLGQPGGAVTGGIEGSVGAGPGGAIVGGLTQLGHWIVDGLLIVVGVALVIAGLLIIARGGDSHSVTLTAPEGGGGAAPTHPREAAAAEDAAEVAA